MLLNIALIVSLCSGVSLSDVQKKKSDLEKQFPGAKVSVRVSKKCTK